MSLAACILITLYVQDELSYDQHWQNADRIYRVNLITKRAGRPPQAYPAGSMLMLPALEQFFPDEIELGSRLRQTSLQEIEVDNVRYQDSISFAGEDIIKLFQFEVLGGNLDSVFLDVNSIALSEESAVKYFGDSDPIGATVSAGFAGGDPKEYRVVAVYRLAAGNTVLSLPNLAMYEELKIPGEGGWLLISGQTFVRFRAGFKLESIRSRLPELLDRHASLPASRMEAGQTPSDVLGLQLQVISDIYFNPIAFINYDQVSGNKPTALMFMAISVLVVLIGCVNFVVLTTAMSAQRGLEVAMRKMFGAQAGQLRRQFLGESLQVTLAAFLLALLIVELLVPVFEGMVDKNLQIPYLEAKTWLYLLALFAVVGLLGGMYPAMVLSNATPGRALSTNHSSGPAGAFRLRGALLIFQFAVSIILIIATAVVYGQLSYTSNLDPGFNPENLLIVEGFTREEISSKQVFKQEVLKLADVSHAGFSAGKPNSGRGIILDYSAGDSTSANRNLAISTLFIGYGFFQTYQIPLLAGRYPDQARDPGQRLLFLQAATGEQSEGLAEQPAKILLNETATRRLGLESAEAAVGTLIKSGEPGAVGFQEFEIIGVVADSQFKSLRAIPEAVVYYVQQDNSSVMTLRFRGDPQSILGQIESVWETLTGGEPFTAVFAEQELANTFLRERNEARLLATFSLLSILIAGLGLFGITTFSVERRSREIALRKVMGAETGDIIVMLGWQFSKPVFIAALVAWPIAVWTMLDWLQRFPYQFNSLLLVPLCVVAGLIVLAIVWLTVVTNTRKMAAANPIEALRCE